jgi:hypothetical protein
MLSTLFLEINRKKMNKSIVGVKKRCTFAPPQTSGFSFEKLIKEFEKNYFFFK